MCVLYIKTNDLDETLNTALFPAVFFFTANKKAPQYGAFVIQK